MTKPKRHNLAIQVTASQKRAIDKFARTHGTLSSPMIRELVLYAIGEEDELWKAKRRARDYVRSLDRKKEEK